MPNYMNPQTLNRYSYCNNNPLKYVDPSGHSVWSWLNDNIFQPIGDFVGGVAEGIWDTGAAIVTAVTHPVETLKGIVNAVTHPIETVKAVWNQFYSNSQTANGIGKNVGNIIGMFLPGGAAKGVSTLAKATGLTEKVAAAANTLGTTRALPGFMRIGAGGETAISTSRYTQAGETFYHYGFMEQADSFLGGLRARSYATTEGGLTGAEATSGLSLSHALNPDAVYAVTPKPGTLIVVNPVTCPKGVQPGGLPEIFFPLGTGPGTVSGPFMIP